MGKCKVAIVGAGYMATEHAKAFADVPGVEVSGVFSRTRARAETLAAQLGIARVCDSVAQLYAQTQAQLVVVTVTELSMREVSGACFEFPWTILLEKPAGYNAAEAEAIAAAARARGREVYVALNRRFYSSTRGVLEAVRNIESERFIHLQDQEDQHRALGAGQPQLVVDNWMYANSIHVIDYLRMFGRGSITSVTPVVAWNPRQPGLVLTKVQFDSGDIGLYEAIWNAPGPWSVAISTAQARFEMRPVEQASVQARGERRAASLALHDWDQAFKPGLRLQAAHAVAAALGQPSESIPIDEALQTMLLVRDIYGLRQ